MEKILTTLMRYFTMLSVVVLFLFVIFMCYGELVEREGGNNTAFASTVRRHLYALTLYAADYLHETPITEQGVNIVDKLEFAGEDPETYLPLIKNDRIAFYVSGDVAWVGFKLPEIFWSRGINMLRKSLQESKSHVGSNFYGIHLYGTNSLAIFPANDREQYHYRQENEVIWCKVDQRLHGRLGK